MSLALSSFHLFGETAPGVGRESEDWPLAVLCIADEHATIVVGDFDAVTLSCGVA